MPLDTMLSDVPGNDSSTTRTSCPDIKKKGPVSDLLKMHFHLTHLNSAIGEFKAFNYLCRMRDRRIFMLVNILGAEKLSD